ncbi:MAG: DDE-type integrase/transposase/recombinase [Chloroflexi bacterium]|nr:DDE-type integrase/transposase/recombinase [Chloroflexota bacterium]
MKTSTFQERKLAIFQLRKGKKMEEVAENMNRSLFWVSKWNKRYQEEGWPGLQEQSRAPKQHGKQLPMEIREVICDTRLELEVEAALGIGLKYIGGQAIKTRLKAIGIKPVPSVSSIERVLRETGLVRRKAKPPEPEVHYPRLRPVTAHQLCQVDIVPHFLRGGQRVSCFNAIDIVSRYPTGQAFAQRRSLDAVQFLIHVWQEIGIPKYTQVDNEGCFSGGTTHKHVLGKVVRLALTVGTELLFSPVYHPQSNGSVERFHQDYNRHVWEDTYLENIAKVNQQADWFFDLYRKRLDHGQLGGQSPQQLHHHSCPQKAADDFVVTEAKMPLREGRVHFMRRLSEGGQVRVLNDNWAVPGFDPTKGVWVTIVFKTTGAMLSIFDEAPDRQDRRCIVSYPFPLNEPILAQEKTSNMFCTNAANHTVETRKKTTTNSTKPSIHILGKEADDISPNPEPCPDMYTDLWYSFFHAPYFFSMY